MVFPQTRTRSKSASSKPGREVEETEIFLLHPPPPAGPPEESRPNAPLDDAAAAAPGTSKAENFVRECRPEAGVMVTGVAEAGVAEAGVPGSEEMRVAVEPLAAKEWSG